jgi:glucose/mannose-6-phosphate isomerase
MWEAACAWPEQLTDALEAARRALAAAAGPADTPVRAVVAFGVGTGGAACDAAAALTAGQLAVPFIVRHDSVVPALVGPDCLVVAASFGAAPETVLAARESQARGAPVVAIGNDAGLARLAAGAGLPWCDVGAEGPAGRAAFGPATVSVLGALAAAGLVSDCSAEVRTAGEFVARRRGAFVAERGTAAELARRIGRTIPLVYGSSGVAAVAARQWKSCVNLNAKSPAFAAELPGLAYDELAGWGQGGDITRQTMTLVFLRHGGEPSAVPALFEAVRAATEEVMADVLEVWADSDHELGRLFELVLLGELVSLELAAREGVDPGPVPAVEEAHAAPRAAQRAPRHR